MTLISTISDSLDAVNWTDPNHIMFTIYWGASLGKYGASTFATEADYQNKLGTYSGYAEAARLIASGYFLNFYSGDLTQEALDLMDNVDMLDHLPHNYTTGGKNYFLGYRYGQGLIYRFSRDMSYQKSKFDNSLAWQEVKAGCVANGNKGFMAYNPVTGELIPGTGRTYDEHAQCLAFLLNLYELDKTNNAGALTYARDTLWAYINTTYWTIDHYAYSTTNTGYECEGSNFPIVFAKLRALNGYSLTNWDNVITDIKARFLTAEWDAPQWTFNTTKYYAVIHHHTINDQRRLENTLTAWIMLHAFYQILDTASQTHMTNLLDGATKAWEYLVSATPGLYDSETKKFKEFNTSSTTDFATTWGIVCLFLMGIVPQTGSLYIPLFEWQYQGTALNHYFLFDYAGNRIKIPVKAGSIKFIYGSTPVTYTFSENGVYEVTFSSNWNLISKAVKVSDLNPHLHYVVEVNMETEGGKLYETIKDLARRHGEIVTRRNLVLGIRHAETGWKYKDYEESNIYLILIPKSAQIVALQCGTYVNLDAIGITTSYMTEGDEVVGVSGAYYEVKTVQNVYFEGKFSHRLCDLKEMPLHA